MGIPAAAGSRVNLVRNIGGVNSSFTGDPDGLEIDPPAGELTLLFEENFETGTLQDKTWISHNAGNLGFSAIVDSPAGGKALRHNMYSALVGNDPISGKPGSQLNNHTFLANQFYSVEDHPEITFEQTLRFDDCRWKSSVADPIVNGKLFITDSTVDQLACYLGLGNDDDLTFVSGNTDSGPWDIDGVDSWYKRPEGWRTATAGGVPTRWLNFNTPNPIFRSDGISRTLRFEVRYNPGNIGHHKGRFSINGTVIHDKIGVNTDVNGWFNLPIEFEFRGTRAITAGVDFSTPLDIVTNPGVYTGYVAGFEASNYKVYSGVHA